MQVYLDTVGDPDKYRVKLCERFSSIKFVVSKKADSLYPVVSGASIVAKVMDSHCPISKLFLVAKHIYILPAQVTRDRALREWLVEETGENINRNFGSGYPGGTFFPSNRVCFQ